MYYQGEGVTADKAEAAKWAAMVAESVETTEYVLMQKAAKDSFVP